MKKFHKKTNYKLIQNNTTRIVNYYIGPIISQEQAEINELFKAHSYLLHLLQSVCDIRCKADRALCYLCTFKMIVRKKWIDRFFEGYNDQKIQLMFCRTRAQYNGRIMENGCLINRPDAYTPYDNVYCAPTAETLRYCRGWPYCRSDSDCRDYSILVCVAYDLSEYSWLNRNKKNILPIFLAYYDKKNYFWRD